MQIIQWDGQRISRPGIYANIPSNDYHRGDICDGPSVSSSSLRTIWNESPAHFWAKSPLNPDRIEEEPSDAFIVGRAAHHLICGEPYFDREYVIRPEKAPDGRAWNSNNNTCKAWLAEQASAGRTVLTPDMGEIILGMHHAVRSHPVVQTGILDGLVEHSMFWRDAATGLWLKARPDVIPNDSGDFSDLKTTQSVQYLDLQKSLADFGYCQQGALTLDGARELKMEAHSFALVWVEKKKPHCVSVKILRNEAWIDEDGIMHPSDLALGSAQNRYALDIIAACLRAQCWPGPGDDRDVEFLDLPYWKRRQIEERLKLSQLGTIQ